MGGMISYNDVPRQLDVSFYGSVEPITPTISKCRLRIFYKGLNRNRTYISDDFANQLISSLPYAPVKGIFNYSDVDFEDHGEDNTDGRIYGIVPENHNFAWEPHIDKDGVERIYATTDVYLFTGLYPEASLISGKPQSMEIFKDNLRGEWKIWEEDGRPYFHFYSGCLVGLQTLGKDVEPCFEGSAFFSLCKDLQNCIDYIKKLDNTKEVEKMDKSIFRLSDNEKCKMLFDAINPNYNAEGNWAIDYSILDVYDDYALCYNHESNQYIRVYYTKDDAAETVSIGGRCEVFIVDITASEYAALETMKAIGGTFEASVEVYNELNAKVEAYTKASTETVEKSTESGESVENADTSFEAVKAELEARIAELEAAQTSYEEAISVKDSEIETFNAKIEELTAENVRLQTENSDITTERDALNTFKANIETEQKTAIIDEFADHLTDEQISSFKETMGNYSIADFKKELCAAAYEADPSIFSKKEDEGLIFTGANSTGKMETGAMRLLNKYKNGGNK